MIKPLKAIANKTMVSNPIALNPHNAYRNTMNYMPKGEKLNIDCNEVRSLSKDGLKLDILA